MVRDVIFIAKQVTYRELRDLLLATPHLVIYSLYYGAKEAEAKAKGKKPGNKRRVDESI